MSLNPNRLLHASQLGWGGRGVAGSGGGGYSVSYKGTNRIRRQREKPKPCEPLGLERLGEQEIPEFKCLSAPMTVENFFFHESCWVH